MPGQQGQQWITPWVREATSLSLALRADFCHPGGTLLSPGTLKDGGHLQASPALGRSALRQCQSWAGGVGACSRISGPGVEGQKSWTHHSPHWGSSSSLQTSNTSSANGTITVFCSRPCRISHSLWGAWRGPALCWMLHMSFPCSTGEKAGATEKANALLQGTTPSWFSETGHGSADALWGLAGGISRGLRSP